MKKVILILVLALAFLGSLSGCSGIQATPEMTKKIEMNSAVAEVRLATEQTPESAKEGLVLNAAVFAEYHESSTINWFAYAFDPEKQIFCTATYYTLLNKASVASRVVKKNIDKYDSDALKELFIETNKWLVQTNDGLKGSDIRR